MELKDNIKQLRLKEGLTQAQLAQKLYVSRSTVAKWENGLGIPNPESMAALEELFSITAKDIATQEPETIIVNKNRKIHIFLQSVFWICLIAFLSLLYILPFAIQEGKYGFTADMVADSYADEKHIANISKVLPQVAEQVILVVMNKDWEYAQANMSDKVGMIYQIEKHSEVNSSIRRND